MRDYQSFDLKGVPLSNPANLAAFTMFNHSPSKVNKNRFKVLTNSFSGFNHDGLKNIKEITNLKKVILYRAFTHLLIDVGIEII